MLNQNASMKNGKDKLRVSRFVTKRLDTLQINKNGEEKDKNKTGH